MVLDSHVGLTALPASIDTTAVIAWINNAAEPPVVIKNSGIHQIYR